MHAIASRWPHQVPDGTDRNGSHVAIDAAELRSNEGPDETCDRFRRFPHAQRACVIRGRFVRLSEGKQCVAEARTRLCEVRLERKCPSAGFRGVTKGAEVPQRAPDVVPEIG